MSTCPTPSPSKISTRAGGDEGGNLGEADFPRCGALNHAVLVDGHFERASFHGTRLSVLHLTEWLDFHRKPIWPRGLILPEPVSSSGATFSRAGLAGYRNLTKYQGSGIFDE